MRLTYKDGRGVWLWTPEGSNTIINLVANTTKEMLESVANEVGEEENIPENSAINISPLFVGALFGIIACAAPGMSLADLKQLLDGAWAQGAEAVFKKARDEATDA